MFIVVDYKAAGVFDRFKIHARNDWAARAVKVSHCRSGVGHEGNAVPN